MAPHSVAQIAGEVTHDVVARDRAVEGSVDPGVCADLLLTPGNDAQGRTTQTDAGNHLGAGSTGGGLSHEWLLLTFDGDVLYESAVFAARRRRIRLSRAAHGAVVDDTAMVKDDGALAEVPGLIN